jgi:hypothetical protein
MIAEGRQTAAASIGLGLDSAAAKRAYFRSMLNAPGPASSWACQRVLLDRRDARTTPPEVVRVRCGNRIHRLRLAEYGGPAILLDHPRLNRKAELALVALGAPYPDCLLVFDAVTGRVGSRNILWRRRAYAIADRASDRRQSRRRGPTPALKQSLVERYARFVRHRASLLLCELLPARTRFEVRVIPPEQLRPTIRQSELWSWRNRPGVTPRSRYHVMTVHVPFDWHVAVEQAHASALQSAFVIDARSDRRGRMIQMLQAEVVHTAYWPDVECTTRIEAIDAADSVTSKRWQRARMPCRIRLACKA